MRTPDREPVQPRRRRRRGMALATVILFLFVLTAGLAAGFMVNVGERRVDDGALQATNVIAMAEGGLERALVDRAGLGLVAAPPAAAESVRVSVAGGTVDILVTQIRPAVGVSAALYLLRSHAIRTQKTAGSESSAEQTVTQYASWQPGHMDVTGGWTSFAGIVKNGNSGVISGVDQCGQKASLPAVSVPAVPGYSGPQGPLQGTPLIDTTQGHSGTAMASTNPINWAGIISGTALTPTYTVPPQAYPSSAQFADTNFWPVIKIVNPYTGAAPGTPGSNWSLPYAGRGMLIVEGDMTVSGSNMWSGVVLAGGSITSNGNNSIDGATVSGLNVKLGYTVGVESVGNGTKHYQYNSCSVSMATAAMGSLRPFQNTWSTSWPSY
jgi:hypothetical protein